MARIRLKRKGLPALTGGTLYAPRAPAAPRFGGQNVSGRGPIQPIGVGQNASGTGRIQPGLTTHQVGQNAGAPPTPAPAPHDPGQTVPSAPPMPPVPVADSEYYGWLAQRQGEINQQQIQYDAEDKNDLAARNEALRRMAIQRPEDLLTTNRNFNRQGLFYSGALGKERGNIEADYARQEGDTRAAYQRNHDAREAARQALLSGFSLEQAAQMAAAADRAAGRDADAAAIGALAGPADPALAPAAGPPPLPPPPGAHGPSSRPGLGMNFTTADALRRAAKRKHGGGGRHQYGR